MKAAPQRLRPDAARSSPSYAAAKAGIIHLTRYAAGAYASAGVRVNVVAPGMRPLGDIRVLDFTVLPPGAVCTVMLADLGAEVIRVEPPAQKGKPSTVFGQMAMSRAKRSLTINTRDPAPAAVLERLAPTVDVIVENAPPGSMEKRGFG